MKAASVAAGVCTLHGGVSRTSDEMSRTAEGSLEITKNLLGNLCQKEIKTEKQKLKLLPKQRKGMSANRIPLNSETPTRSSGAVIFLYTRNATWCVTFTSILDKSSFIYNKQEQTNPAHKTFGNTRQ